jgi:hypothetical protein
MHFVSAVAKARRSVAPIAPAQMLELCGCAPKNSSLRLTSMSATLNSFEQIPDVNTN